MQHWNRQLLPYGFEWTHLTTGTRVQVQIQDNRWTATLTVLLTSGENQRTRFFVEDCFDASLQKCLLYVWQALSVVDRATFELREAHADLRRFVD